MADNTYSKQKGANDGKTTNPKVIATRLNDSWAFVKDYLDMLGSYVCMPDRGFWRRFKQLLDYVNSKIKLPEIGGDIIDISFVVWQKSDKDDERQYDADFEKWIKENVKWIR